jgi:cell volume regulation protein A
VGLSLRRAHSAAANKLDLATDEPKTGNDFGIELPDELESQLSELTLTEESLADGNRLQDMRPGDILLTIAQQSMTESSAKQ